MTNQTVLSILVVMAPSDENAVSRRAQSHGRTDLLASTCRLMCLAILVFLASCNAPRATLDATVAFDWTEDGLTGRRISTQHFELVSTLSDVEFEEALPDFLETLYSRFEKELGPLPPDCPKLKTYLFGSRGQWQRYVHRHFPGRFPVYSRIRAGGFTEGTSSVSFYVRRASTLATIAHETWHQYVNAGGDRSIPAWLNEGLACYHESVSFGGRKPKFTPRHNTFRINSLRTAVQSDRLLTVRQLVETNAGQVMVHDPDRLTQTYYAQAWALVTFLRHDTSSRRQTAFRRMLADLGDGSFGVHVGAARLGLSETQAISSGVAVLHAYFDASPEELQDDYYDYVVRLCGY